jgi:hypothetical protein
MDGGAGSEYGEMQTRCVRWARSSVFGPRGRFGAGYRVPGAGYPTFRLGSRCSVSDPRPWKDEGQGRYDFPRILRPGRRPDTESGTRDLVPGTRAPFPPFKS